MSVQRHQFGGPGKLTGDLETRLKRWFTAATALAPGFWNKAFPFEATFELAGCLLNSTSDALQALPDPGVAFRIQIGHELPTLLTMPRSLVLALVAGLLGDASSDPVTDREMTSVEETLHQYFLQQLFLPPLRETWSGAEALAFTVEEQEPYPQWTRLFTGVPTVAVCLVTMRGPFGEQKAHWLFPQKPLLELLETSADTPPAAASETAQGASELQPIVQRLPVEIAVELGSAGIRLQQLARLQVGDVLILDQRVTEPLTALVEGKKKLRVWPGRLGDWMAVQVDSP